MPIAPSGPPSPPSIEPIESTTLPATGSTSSRHAGSVASTHSARLQAADDVAPDGKDVASSSQSSARRSASSTGSRSAVVTDGSSLAATVWRATSRARSQLTGPPCHDSSCPSRWKAAPMSPPPAPNIAASGSVGEPPPACRRRRSPLRSSSPSPGPGLNPKGRLLMSASLGAVGRVARVRSVFSNG